NDGTPVRASLPGRSDADELVGCGCDHNLEAVTDLKIGAGTARIEQTYERNLGGRGDNSQNQSEQDPHNAPIRVHSNRAILLAQLPAPCRIASTDRGRITCYTEKASSATTFVRNADDPSRTWARG